MHQHIFVINIKYYLHIKIEMIAFITLLKTLPLSFIIIKITKNLRVYTVYYMTLYFKAIPFVLVQSVLTQYIYIYI